MTVDIGHQWGGDLEVGPTGNLGVVTPITSLPQRILRRLLTNPNDYIWNLDYGAGLPRFIGQPTDQAQIEAMVLSQLRQEASISRVDTPVVNLIRNNQDPVGTFSLHILYQDVSSDMPQSLTIPVSV